MKRISLVLHGLPSTPLTGGQLRIYNLARFLRDSVTFDLISYSSDLFPEQIEPQYRDAFGAIDAAKRIRTNQFSMAARAIGGTLRGMPILTGLHVSPRDASMFREVIRSARPPGWIEFQDGVSGLLWAQNRWARGAIGTVGVSFLNLNLRGFGERAAELLDSPLRRRLARSHARAMKALEAQLISRVDYAIACSFEDREAILRIRPELSTEVIPNGTDTQRATPGDPVVAPHILFVGDLGYRPYRHGLTWFLSAVYPRILAEHPDATVAICGRVPQENIRKSFGSYRGVVIHASPPELDEYYRNARVAIVPLMVAGGGTRLKIPEAMAWGVPVVSTAVGAEGLGLRPEEEILLGDTPEEFASQVNGVIESDDRYARIRASARRRVEADYSWRVISQKLRGFYERIGASNEVQ